MSNTYTLSKQEMDDFNYILSLSKPDECINLDFSDEVQHRYFYNSILRSGMTPENYPQFFKTLEQTRKLHIKNGGPSLPNESAADGNDPGLQDTNIITSASFNDSAASIGAIDSAATALSSVQGGTIYTLQILQIVDSSGNLIENSHQSNGQGEYENILTDGSLSSSQGVAVLYTYSYKKPNDQIPVNKTIVRNLTDDTVGTPKVNDPVLKPAHSTMPYIKMGLGRPASNYQGDCDYTWNEQTQDNPIVRVPFTGSQTFKSNIVPNSWSKYPIVCLMTLTDKGGSGPSITPTTDLLSRINILPDDSTTLQWDFTYDPDVSKDKSIQFGNATFTTDSETSLSFIIHVNTQNYPVAPVPVSITGTTNSQFWSPSGIDQSGTYWIRPFLYSWHCVAEDTLIKLSDGTSKRIDELTNHDAVISNAKGDILRVMDTVFQNNVEKILSINDELGHKLRITGKHAVVTVDGIKLAKELHAGDTLVTEDGPAKIVSIRNIKFNKRVWGIGLMNASGDTSTIVDDSCTYFANGILVGDSHISRKYSRLHSSSLDTILTKLPKKWHTDAKNSYKARNTSEV